MEEVKESMYQMQQLFQSQMEKFQSELDKSSTASSLVADFNAFKSFMLKALQALQSQVQSLAHNIDSLEMHSRKKFILLHGLPEASGEDTASLVTKTIVERLKISDFTAGCVSRCHRMGRVSVPDKPRPVLAKIRDMAIRSKVWQAKSNLKGTGITMSEFLTKSRHDLFMAARQRFGVTKCWTREGTIFVMGPDGQRHRVHTQLDFDKIKGLPASASSNNSTPKLQATAARDPAPGKLKRTVTRK